MQSFILHPRDVRPGAVGLMFLVPVDPGSPAGPYECHFLRVRVVMNAINVADMQKVEEYARALAADGVEYMAFVCGRDVPLPLSAGDTRELSERMREATEMAAATGQLNMKKGKLQ